MRSIRVILALVLAATVLGATGSPARAEDDGAATVWAPYLIVGASTVEITNVGDHPTWPQIVIYYRVTEPAPSCYVGVCQFWIQGPRIESGDSWIFDPADRACGAGMLACLPDGAVGGASIKAAIETGTGANAGATSFDPDGRLVASATVPSGTYDAVEATTAITLTDVGRRVADNDGLTTAIRLIGASGFMVDWYLDDQLVVEQQAGAGSYCCGETGYVRTGPRTIDPRDVDGLDDDATYTVVITLSSGDPFAAVLTYAEER